MAASPPIRLPTFISESLNVLNAADATDAAVPATVRDVTRAIGLLIFENALLSPSVEAVIPAAFAE